MSGLALAVARAFEAADDFVGWLRDSLLALCEVAAESAPRSWLWNGRDEMG